MSSAREEILGRIRGALADTPDAADVAAAEVAAPVGWTYHRRRRIGADLLDHFDERVADYRATVLRAAPDEVAAMIRDELTDRGVRSVVVPAGADSAWAHAVRGAGIEVLDDVPPLSAVELDRVDAVVTGIAVGIAETGTIVLDHTGDQGRRAVSLIPDLHLCVVRADQVVTDMPEAVGRLGAAAAQGRPMTWISGPSATSDIELNRVEGVHGPRTLVVLLVGE